jgi:hypothetical protein
LRDALLLVCKRIVQILRGLPIPSERIQLEPQVLDAGPQLRASLLNRPFEGSLNAT